jgi:hypothetical protein
VISIKTINYDNVPFIARAKTKLSENKMLSISPKNQKELAIKIGYSYSATKTFLQTGNGSNKLANAIAKALNIER